MTNWFAELTNAVSAPAAEEFSPTPPHGPELGTTAAALHHEISKNTLERAHEEHQATAKGIGNYLAAVGAQLPAPPADGQTDPQLSPRGMTQPAPRETTARVTLAAIPRTFLSKARVSVPRLVDGKVQKHEVPASEALGDVGDEIKAVSTLAERTQQHGLKSALATLHPVLKDFDVDPITEAAAHYERNGASQADAEQRAIGDHLQDLHAERTRIEAEVVSAFKDFDPERYAQIASADTEEASA